jgi:hypothetical protein
MEALLFTPPQMSHAKMLALKNSDHANKIKRIKLMFDYECLIFDKNQTPKTYK